MNAISIIGPPDRHSTMTPAKGDVWESPGGMQVIVKSVDGRSKTATCDVHRTYRDKDNKMVGKVNERVVPFDLFPTFVRAYKKL